MYQAIITHERWLVQSVAPWRRNNVKGREVVDRNIERFAAGRLSRYPGRIVSWYAERSVSHGLLAGHEILIELLVPILAQQEADSVLSVIMEGAQKNEDTTLAQLSLLLQRSKNEGASVPVLMADQVSESEAGALVDAAGQLIQLLVMECNAGNVQTIRAVLAQEAQERNPAAQLTGGILNDTLLNLKQRTQ